MNQNPAPLLFIVTGSRGAGKTTFCNRIVESAREAGWQPAGIISLPVFEGSLRTAIDAVDVRTRAVKRIAVRSDRPTPGTQYWRFDDSGLDWGNAVLESSTPCDLLVVDELGPLEFEREGGWQAGIKAIDSSQYAVAFVVIRAEFLGEAILRWSDANLVEIETPEDSLHKARVLSQQLF